MRKLSLITPIAIIFSMVALFVVSCDPENEPVPEVVKVESISITNPSPLTLMVGDTETLVVEIAPADAANKDYEILVGDPAIVTVSSETNLITAVAEGTTTITAKAADGGLEAVLEVVVEKEDEPTPDPLTFTFDLADVTSDGAIITITPSDQNVVYFAEMMDRAWFDEYGSAEDACADFISMYDEMGYLEYVLFTGTFDLDMSRYCQPNTEYIVMAVGYADGQMTSEVATFEFTTPEEEKSDLTFTFEPNGGYVTVIPSDPNVMYFAEAMDLPWYEEYGNPTDACSALIDMYAEWGMLEYYLVSGTYDLDMSYFPAGDEFRILAVGYENGQMTSEVAMYTYTIPEDEPEGLTFTFEPNGGYVTIIPSDPNVMYFAEAMDLPWYEEYGNPTDACSALIDMYAEWGMLEYYLVSGTYDLDMSYFPAGDEFRILAVGYENGQMTSDVTMYTYTIPAL